MKMTWAVNVCPTSSHPKYLQLHIHEASSSAERSTLALAFSINIDKVCRYSTLRLSSCGLKKPGRKFAQLPRPNSADDHFDVDNHGVNLG